MQYERKMYIDNVIYSLSYDYFSSDALTKIEPSL